MQRCPIFINWQDPNSVNMAVFPVSVYRMNIISIKIPAVLFLVIGDPEIHMKNKGSKIAKRILTKEDQVEAFTVSNFKTCYKATVNQLSRQCGTDSLNTQISRKEMKAWK